MTDNTIDSELDDKVFALAMKFAKDCGEQALGERDFDKIKEIYKKFSIDIQILFLNKLAQEANKAVVAELEQFRTNTGQYEIERNYPTPSGNMNWNTDIKARNKLRAELDKKLTDRIAQLTADKEQAALQNKTNDGGRDGD